MLVKELVCNKEFEADQIALNAGHVRKVRPELYEKSWAAVCDIMLVGDLMDACHVPDLDCQGIELKCSMQAGKWNTAASVLDHLWFVQCQFYETVQGIARVHAA